MTTVTRSDDLYGVAMDAVFSYPDYNSDQLVAAVSGLYKGSENPSEESVREAVMEALKTF